MTDNQDWLPTNKNIEDYLLLNNLLSVQKTEFNILSSKKADTPLNLMKIKIVNRVLTPLKELFTYEESHDFLDVLNEEEIPTNSDVVLIISQYITAINEFKDKHFIQFKYGQKEWLTEERLPEFIQINEGL